jgi:predicted membrane GTPase involved in stress response
VRVGDRIKVLQHEAGTAVNDSSLKVTRIEKRAGLGKVQLQAAVAGDVVSLAGAGDAAGIADTIAAPAVEQGLDPGPIDPPTLRWAALLQPDCAETKSSNPDRTCVAALKLPGLLGLVE